MQNKLNQQVLNVVILAIIIVGGFFLLKDSKPPTAKDNAIPLTTLAPVGTDDRTLGNSKASVVFILYEDFQCPFCAASSGLVSGTNATNYLIGIIPEWTPFMSGINEYIKNGTVLFVYRDYAFLGPESVKAAEAARCAGDQGKFWEYHDYLYTHQKGENQGTFSNPNLKSFAKDLGLNTSDFDKCLDKNKYTQAVTDSNTEGVKAGVTGTPKGFILRDGKIISTIDGAESFTTAKLKFENALK